MSSPPQRSGPCAHAPGDGRRTRRSRSVTRVSNFAVTGEFPLAGGTAAGAPRRERARPAPSALLPGHLELAAALLPLQFHSTLQLGSAKSGNLHPILGTGG